MAAATSVIFASAPMATPTGSVVASPSSSVSVTGDDCGVHV
jgi:hypothetical protein